MWPKGRPLSEPAGDTRSSKHQVNFEIDSYPITAVARRMVIPDIQGSVQVPLVQRTTATAMPATLGQLERGIPVAAMVAKLRRREPAVNL